MTNKRFSRAWPLAYRFGFLSIFFILSDYWFGIEADVKIKKQKGQREGRGEEGMGGESRGDEKRRGC